MNKTLIDLTGQRHGKLIVVERATAVGVVPVKWLCRCDCGGTKVVDGKAIRRGGAADHCGCLSAQRKIEIAARLNPEINPDESELIEHNGYLLTQDMINRFEQIREKKRALDELESKLENKNKREQYDDHRRWLRENFGTALFKNNHRPASAEARAWASGQKEIYE